MRYRVFRLNAPPPVTPSVYLTSTAVDPRDDYKILTWLDSVMMSHLSMMIPLINTFLSGPDERHTKSALKVRQRLSSRRYRSSLLKPSEKDDINYLPTTRYPLCLAGGRLPCANIRGRAGGYIDTRHDVSGLAITTTDRAMRNSRPLGVAAGNGGIVYPGVRAAAYDLLPGLTARVTRRCVSSTRRLRYAMPYRYVTTRAVVVPPSALRSVTSRKNKATMCVAYAVLCAV